MTYDIQRIVAAQLVVVALHGIVVLQPVQGRRQASDKQQMRGTLSGLP